MAYNTSFKVIIRQCVNHLPGMNCKGCDRNIPTILEGGGFEPPNPHCPATSYKHCAENALKNYLLD
jgi:hypothetical protein